MSEKEKMVAQGTCRYCGQLRNVMYWSDDELPRAELKHKDEKKIRQYEMDGNPEYGVCAKIPAHRLRQIFNYLVLKEYLYLTDDGYTIVKLTAASRSLLEEAHILTMKMSKELETKKKGSVYTDFRLAAYLAQTVMPGYSGGAILDPSCGSSILLVFLWVYGLPHWALILS